MSTATRGREASAEEVQSFIGLLRERITAINARRRDEIMSFLMEKAQQAVLARISEIRLEEVVSALRDVCREDFVKKAWLHANGEMPRHVVTSAITTKKYLNASPAAKKAIDDKIPVEIRRGNSTVLVPPHKSTLNEINMALPTSGTDNDFLPADRQFGGKNYEKHEPAQPPEFRNYHEAAAVEEDGDDVVVTGGQGSSMVKIRIPKMPNELAAEVIRLLQGE